MPEIDQTVPALCGGLILLGVAGRLARRHAERGPDHRVRARRAHRAERLTLREIHGVAGAQERVEIAAPGRVDPDEISEQREDRRLVEDHPVRDAIAERADHDLGVVREAARRVALGPAAAVFERLRQVPVVERRERADPRLEQAVDEAPVVVEPLRVRAAGAFRLDARPGDREAVAREIHRAQERDVLAEAVIGIARDVARVAVTDHARRVREAIPDRLALAVLLPGALDLIRRGGGAPVEAVRKPQARHRTPESSRLRIFRARLRGAPAPPVPRAARGAVRGAMRRKRRAPTRARRRRG